MLTTIHATDIPDIDGDIALRRNTFPIAFPFCSRMILATSLLIWSFYEAFSAAGPVMVIVDMLGLCLALFYVVSPTTSGHKDIYYLYIVSAKMFFLCALLKLFDSFGCV